MNINIETLIGFVLTVSGIIWKLSELKNQLEKEIDAKHDESKDFFNSINNRLDLLSQKIDNENSYINNRISGLHNNTKNKIVELDYKFNEIVGYLEKLHPDNKFIIRSRIMNKETYDPESESWTQIKKK